VSVFTRQDGTVYQTYTTAGGGVEFMMGYYPSLACRTRRPALAGGGVRTDQSVIAYCGGGISATVDLFALSLVGRDDARLVRRLADRVERPPGPAPRHRLTREIAAV
jgi:hypothetical protein